MDLTTLALAKGYTDKQIERAAMGDMELDSSLTKAGFAADAAAVGEAIKNIDLSSYATEQWVKDGYQPKGEYALATDIYSKTEIDNIMGAYITDLAALVGGDA